MFEIRFLPLVMAIVLSAAFAVALAVHPNFIWLWIGFGIAVFFLAVGLHDIWQKPSAVLRNYPIAAHIRFLLEDIRPELRQYFFESEKDGLPFSRDERAIVYQRAKLQLDVRPFGTTYNVYEPGFEWINHSMSPAAAQQGALPHHHRRAGLHEALLGLGVQHLRHELRVALGQRDPCAERRRQARRLCARHR